MSLKKTRPDVPEGIERIIGGCLEKDRARRYQNVAALAQALAPFGGVRARASLDRISRVIHSGGATPVPSDSGSVSGAVLSGGSSTRGAFSLTGAPHGRNRSVVIGAIVAVGALAAGGIFYAVGSGEPQQSAPVAAVSPPPVATPSPSAPPATSAPAPPPVEPPATAPPTTATPPATADTAAKAAAAQEPAKAKPRPKGNTPPPPPRPTAQSGAHPTPPPPRGGADLFNDMK
jgi:serine/threonine-protein kinase